MERVLVAGLHNVRTHRCVSTYISMCTMSHWSVLCVAIYQAPITRVEPGPHTIHVATPVGNLATLQQPADLLLTRRSHDGRRHFGRALSHGGEPAVGARASVRRGCSRQAFDTAGVLQHLLGEAPGRLASS